MSPSLSAAGGCTGAASFCNSALTYRPPVTNPFSALDSALTTLCGANPTLPATCGLQTTGPCNTGSALVAYTAATPCTNNNVHTKGNTAVTLLRGILHIGYSDHHRRLLVHGYRSDLHSAARGDNQHEGGRDNSRITGPTTAPSASSLPAALQSDASLFQDMAIYDASATRS